MAILIEHIMINHQMLDYPIFRHTLPWVLMTVWICIVSVVSSMKEHWWMMSILWTRASLLSFKSLLDFQHFCHQHPHCKDCSVDSIILIFALGWSHIWPTNMLIHSSDFTCFFCAFFSLCILNKYAWETTRQAAKSAEVNHPLGHSGGHLRIYPLVQGGCPPQF